jgi:ribonuclease BN (tRNA processing enzyme)
MAVSGRDYSEFGMATSCYLVKAGNESIFLDAGSGLVNAPSELPGTPVILLSHLHIDHIMGLGMYTRLSQRGADTRICVPVKYDDGTSRAIDSLFSPPLWPLKLADYNGNLRYEPLSFPMNIGEVTLEGIEGHHPGGCLVMRLNYKGKSIVYVTDYEYEERSFAALTDFSKNADLLLYDGQFTVEESNIKKGYGHSTAEQGVILKEQSGVKRMLIIHHAPDCDDSTLKEREAKINNANVRYAREGDVILL